MASFDWVSARASCSLSEIFLVLKEVLDSDVKSATGLNRRGVEFALKDEAQNKLLVSRQRDVGGIIEGQAVVFELHPHKIEARDARTKTQIATATPHLGLEGKCLLRVSGEAEPMELWQFSRKALEDLFFGF